MLSRLGTQQLIVASALLVGGGLVMIYSASAARSELLFGSPSVYVLRQLAAFALGGAAALILSRIPLERLRRLGYPAYVGALATLIATLGPLGLSENGAQRWLMLAGISFQPLELVKLGLVLGLAQWLAGSSNRMHDFRFSILVPALLVGIPALVLLQQPDFGGAALILLFAAVMIFAAGARFDHLAVTGLLAIPAASAVALLADYRLDRIKSFFDPWADPLGGGYQLIQSQLGFGAGGILGAGLGAGQQKLGYLPEAHTDFILSVIGEETGLVGVGCVLVCLVVIGLASLGIAARAKTAYARLIAVGAGLLLWLQGMLNAGIAMGLLPTKGTTLPFVSYGGTSLAVSVAAFGLLLSVARPSKRGRKGWR